MKDVLILNDSYMPVNIVAMKKAFKMMVKSSIWENLGRKNEYHVDILEYYDINKSLSVGSPTPRPAVIRIAHYKNPPAKKIKIFAPFSRKGVWTRDDGVCQYCGKHIKFEDMHWDHVKPRKLGGKTTWTNIVCACFACNGKKADTPLNKCGMTLLKKPEPVYNETTNALTARDRVVRKLAGNIPSQWKTYLGWIGVQ